jgi:hypothetical protein
LLKAAGYMLPAAFSMRLDAPQTCRVGVRTHRVTTPAD